MDGLSKANNLFSKRYWQKYEGNYSMEHHIDGVELNYVYDTCIYII